MRSCRRLHIQPSHPALRHVVQGSARSPFKMAARGGEGWLLLKLYCSRGAYLRAPCPPRCNQ